MEETFQLFRNSATLIPYLTSTIHLIFGRHTFYWTSGSFRTSVCAMLFHTLQLYYLSKVAFSFTAPNMQQVQRSEKVYDTISHYAHAVTSICKDRSHHWFRQLEIPINLDLDWKGTCTGRIWAVLMVKALLLDLVRSSSFVTVHYHPYKHRRLWDLIRSPLNHDVSLYLVYFNQQRQSHDDDDISSKKMVNYVN